MKLFVKIIIYILISPVILFLIPLMAVPAIIMVLYYWATETNDMVELLLIGVASEIVWLLILAYLLK